MHTIEWKKEENNKQDNKPIPLFAKEQKLHPSTDLIFKIACVRTCTKILFGHPQAHQGTLFRGAIMHVMGDEAIIIVAFLLHCMTTLQLLFIALDSLIYSLIGEWHCGSYRV